MRGRRCRWSSATFESRSCRSLRLALFGGTFDPIHAAHLTIAREAARHCRLDHVLMMPNVIPPHKNKMDTPYEDRYRMVELACDGDPVLVPSRLEAGQEMSYSVFTIARAREAYPQDELFFLIGADAFAEVNLWYRWREAIRAIEFIVVSRPGSAYDVPAGATVHRLDTLALPVSSSLIRQQLARGEMPRELPAAVAGYIRERGLYRE